MRLGIVIPCYNEDEVLPETSKRMSALLDRLTSPGKISRDSTIYFVDDGSKDRTWALIERYGRENPRNHTAAGLPNRPSRRSRGVQRTRTAAQRWPAGAIVGEGSLNSHVFLR